MNTVGMCVTVPNNVLSGAESVVLVARVHFVSPSSFSYKGKCHLDVVYSRQREGVPIWDFCQGWFVPIQRGWL